jgi:transcriptional regulator with XRE-family HTH domain
VYNGGQAVVDMGMPGHARRRAQICAAMAPKKARPADPERGKRIREAREKAGFAHAKDLADHLKVNPHTAYRWERGQNEPEPEQLEAIADLARDPKITPRWLRTGEREPHQLHYSLRAFLQGEAKDIPAAAKKWLMEDDRDPGFEPSTSYWRSMYVAWRNEMDRESARRAAVFSSTMGGDAEK